MRALLRTLALMALVLCASISADTKIYLSNNGDCHLSNYLSMKLEVGEVVKISEIRGDQHGIYIYDSDIQSANRPATLQVTHKFLSDKRAALDDNAWMIEAKVIYYPCECCNNWREIGGRCTNERCPSNNCIG